MRMSNAHNRACVFACLVFTAARCSFCGDFGGVATSSWERWGSAPNLFTNVTESAIVAVRMQTATTNVIVTDRKPIQRLLAAGRSLVVVDGFITMGGTGYYAVQEYMDERTNIVFTATINTARGETLLFGPNGYVGIARQPTYADAVRNLTPFDDEVGRFSWKMKTPNKTGGHIR